MAHQQPGYAPVPPLGPSYYPQNNDVVWRHLTASGHQQLPPAPHFGYPPAPNFARPPVPRFAYPSGPLLAYPVSIPHCYGPSPPLLHPRMMVQYDPNFFDHVSYYDGPSDNENGNNNNNQARNNVQQRNRLYKADLSAEEMLEILFCKYKTHKYTCDMIKKKFAVTDADDDVESGASWTVSLACPLSKSRMRYPCRPEGCTHLQCFDALFFLKMNKQKASWKCPICNGPAPFQTLTLDRYFKTILNSSLLTMSDEIHVEKDGLWFQKPPERKRKREISTNNNDDEEPLRSKSSTSNYVIIDLTGDNSEVPASAPSTETSVSNTVGNNSLMLE